MEADFSIRNEVDSVKPPFEDKTKYGSNPPPYDDLLNNLKNAPPFPQPPYPADINRINQPDYYKLLFENQQRMLLEQQEFNRYITLKILDQQSAWKWVCFSVLGALILILLKKSNF